MSAGGAVIGALRVVLGADTASLDKGLKDSQSNLADFGKTVAAGMAAAAAAVAGAAAVIGVAIKGAIDNADQVNKISQSVGMTTEEFSKLSYAASLSDVSTESLGKSMGKLSKAMLAAATDGASPAGMAFTAMGVAVKNSDGTMRSQSDVLLDVAGKFQGYQDGAAKSALAITLFGKAGAALIPMLNQGRDGLTELGDEAEQFGLVLDKKTTVAAEAFNDNLKKMDSIKQGLYATIAAKLLPSLEQLSETMLDARKNSTLMSDAADFLAGALKAAITVVVAGTTAFSSFGGELSAVWGLIKAFPSGPFSDDWAKALDNFNKAEGDTAAASDALSKTLSNLWNSASGQDWNSQALEIRSMQKEVGLLGEQWTKTAAPIVASGEVQQNAVDQFLASQAKRTASMEADSQTVGKSTAEQAKLRVEYEAQAIALAKNVPLTDALNAKIAATGDAAAAAAMKLQGANLTQDMLAPWDQRNQKLTQYNALLQAGAISQDTFNAASARIQFPNFTGAANAALDFGASADKIATDSLNGLSSTLADVITGAKSAADAFKAFGTQIIAELTQMIVKAVLFKSIMALLGFSTGGPVGVVGAAGDMSVPTYADGGGPINGPGTGTSDSILARVSNGEFIVNADATAKNYGLLQAINNGSTPLLGTSTPQAAVNDGRAVNDNQMSSAPASKSELVVKGIDPKALYTGDMVRALASSLIQFQKDGGKITLAA